jgi:hypothetical protein
MKSYFVKGSLLPFWVKRCCALGKMKSGCTLLALFYVGIGMGNFIGKEGLLSDELKDVFLFEP